MSKQKKNTRLNNIISDLTSKDEKKVLSSIQKLRKFGKREALKPILDTLIASDNQKINQELLSLLYDLKDQSVADDIVLAIGNEKYQSIKPILISLFWQSTLDGSQYLSSFVKEAIEGEYVVGVEVLTVIENFEGTFDESEVTNLKYDIDEAMSNVDEVNAGLLGSIKNALDGLNIEY